MGQLMDYTEALARATELRTALAPHCHRIEIAGSIRRRKAIVKDIELVCIPHTTGAGLFGDIPCHTEGFNDAVRRVMQVVKGSTFDGRYIQGRLSDGTMVDLFTTTDDNWGWILTLRTGSAEHNIRMVQRLKSNGYQCAEGRVKWKGNPIELRDEETVFSRAGLTFTDPQLRV